MTKQLRDDIAAEMRRIAALRSQASEARIAANRENARKSTGPKTEEGKKRSRLNASRHGLTAQITCMTWEDREAHEKFINDFIADLAPVGAVETHLAQSIANDAWRLNRARAAEENVFALNLEDYSGQQEIEPMQLRDALARTRVFWHKLPDFACLTVYEQRIHRTFHKNLATFQEMKKNRPAPKPQTMMAATSAPASAPDSDAEPAPTTTVPAPKPHLKFATAQTESTTSSQIGFVPSDEPQAAAPPLPDAA